MKSYEHVSKMRKCGVIFRGCVILCTLFCADFDYVYIHPVHSFSIMNFVHNVHCTCVQYFTLHYNNLFLP